MFKKLTTCSVDIQGNGIMQANIKHNSMEFTEIKGRKIINESCSVIPNYYKKPNFQTLLNLISNTQSQKDSFDVQNDKNILENIENLNLKKRRQERQQSMENNSIIQTQKIPKLSQKSKSYAQFNNKQQYQSNQSFIPKNLNLNSLSFNKSQNQNENNQNIKKRQRLKTCKSIDKKNRKGKYFSPQNKRKSQYNASQNKRTESREINLSLVHSLQVNRKQFISTLTMTNTSLNKKKQKDQKILDEIIKLNLQKAKIEKLMKSQQNLQESAQKISKQMQIEEINSKIRKQNVTKFIKRNDNLEKRLPWGCNQQRLKTYAIQILQKLYKNTLQGETQIDEQKAQNRRQDIGCQFLNQLSESSVEKMIQNKKNHLSTEEQIQYIAIEKQKESKQKEKNSQKNEIKLFIQMKKQKKEEELNKQYSSQEHIKEKKKQNLQQLLVNIQKKSTNSKTKKYQVKKFNKKSLDFKENQKKQYSNQKDENLDQSILYEEYQKNSEKNEKQLSEFELKSENEEQRYNTEGNKKIDQKNNNKKRKKYKIQKQKIDSTELKDKELNQNLKNQFNNLLQRFKIMKENTKIVQQKDDNYIQQNSEQKQVVNIQINNINEFKTLIDDENLQNNDEIHDDINQNQNEINRLEEYSEEVLEKIAEQIFNNAATYIQKLWRGYYTRKILKYYLGFVQTSNYQNEQYMSDSNNIPKDIKIQDSNYIPQDIKIPNSQQNVKKISDIITFSQSEYTEEDNHSIRKKSDDEIYEQTKFKKNTKQISNKKENEQMQLQEVTEQSLQSAFKDQNMPTNSQIQNIYDNQPTLANMGVGIQPNEQQMIISIMKNSGEFQEQKDEYTNNIDEQHILYEKQKYKNELYELKEKEIQKWNQVINFLTQIDPEINQKNQMINNIISLSEFNMKQLLSDDQIEIFSNDQKEIAVQTSNVSIQKLQNSDLEKNSKSPSNSDKQNFEFQEADFTKKYKPCYDLEIEVLKQNQITQKEDLLKDESKNQLLYILGTQQINREKDKNIISKSTDNRTTLISQSNKSIKISVKNLQNELKQLADQLISTNLPQNIFDQDPYQEFTQKKFKELLKKENVDQIVDMRERAIEVRIKTEFELMNQMIAQKQVSPRSYKEKQNQLEIWKIKEKDDLQITKKEFETGWTKVIDTIQKTQRDIQFSQRYIKINNSCSSKSEYLRSSQSDEDQINQKINFLKSVRNTVSDAESSYDYLTNHNIKIVDSLEGRSQQDLNIKNSDININSINDNMELRDLEDYVGLFYKQNNNNCNIALKSAEDNKILISNLKSDDNINQYLEPVDMCNFGTPTSKDNDLMSYSPTQNNQKQNRLKKKFDVSSSQESLAKIQISVTSSSDCQLNNLKDSYDDKFYLQKQEDSEEFQQQNLQIQDLQNNQDESIFQQKFSQNPILIQYQQQNQIMSQMYSQMNEQLQEKWRIQHMINLRVQEMLSQDQIVDKSEIYGICTNVCIVNEYITNVFNYIISNYKMEFIKNLNIPFGFSPVKRIKLIHGYDVSKEINKEDYATLPFSMPEELFVEFEQMMVGNGGEDEQQQIIKEFEHVHNKSIFDAFNEAFNQFRPFYNIGGPPYLWTNNVNKLKKEIIFENQLHNIFIKCAEKVKEWSGFICGLHADIKQNEEYQDQRISYKYDPNRPLASIQESGPPELEQITNIKDEKLSKMLLKEIQENEFKWYLFEDEKAEVVMELGDIAFEDLVEEFISEIIKNNQQ